MIEKDAKKFLQRMIKHNGFIADDVVRQHPKFWTNNSKCSSTFMDLAVLAYLQNNGLIRQDRCGRFLITKKGKEFATPWYKKWLI